MGTRMTYLACQDCLSGYMRLYILICQNDINLLVHQAGDGKSREGNKDDGKEGPGKPCQTSILMVAACVCICCVLDVES